MGYMNLFGINSNMNPFFLIIFQIGAIQVALKGRNQIA